MAALSACGGNGGVSSTPAPPPVTYTKITDLTGNQTFSTAYTGSSMPLGPLTKPTLLPSGGFGATVTISYNAAADSYSLSGNGVTDTFTQADLQPSSDPKVILLRQSMPNGAPIASTSIVVPSPGGVDLSYTRVGTWMTTRDPAINGQRVYALVAGVPTVASDMPRTGTATFTASSVRGSAISNGAFYSLTNSTATFSANFGANTVQTTLSLVGTPLVVPVAPVGPSLSGSDVAIGTFNGTGTIGTSSNAFSGTFAGATSGSFTGAFFGPQAAEYGYSYSLDFGFSGSSVIGTVAGRR